MTELQSLKATVSRRLEILEKEQAELKTHKEMLHDALLNDGELVELEEKMKEAKKRYLAQKEAVLNEPAMVKIKEKMADVKQGIKECKELLDTDLLGYFKESGRLLITTATGRRYKIKFNSKMEETLQRDLFEEIEELADKGINVEISATTGPLP